MNSTTPALPVHIPAGQLSLTGELQRSSSTLGVVLIFRPADESRSSSVATLQNLLADRGFDTLSVDLLTPQEAGMDRNTGRYHLSIPFLADRICDALAWIRREPVIRELPLALVAHETAVAAALIAASHHPDQVNAIVSYHGRADLAGEALALVRSPTLLIADEEEPHLVDLNRQAARRLRALRRLDVFRRLTRGPGASSGDDSAAFRAVEWIQKHLAQN